MNLNPSRILVVRGGAIGDFVVTLPVLAALRKKYPNAHIEILGYPSIAELAVRRGYAESCSRLDAADMAPFFVQDATLPAQRAEYFSRFDLIISVFKDDEGVFHRNLMKCSRGVVVSINPIPPSGVHASEHLLRSLEPLGITPDDGAPRLLPSGEDRRLAGEFLRERGLERRRLLAIHPGSGSPSKNYPAERFAEIAIALRRRHNLHPIIIRGPADAEPVECVVRNIPAEATVVKEVPLPVLAALLESCTLFIGNDSGISHISAAVGTPTVAIFGPTDEIVWAPRGEAVRIITAPVPCRPCPDETRKICADRRCLKNISIEQVLAAAEELINRGG